MLSITKDISVTYLCVACSDKHVMCNLEASSNKLHSGVMDGWIDEWMYSTQGLKRDNYIDSSR